MKNIDYLDPADYTIASADYTTRSADPTIASAWASSPLGDPRADDGYLSCPSDFPSHPIAPAAKRWQLGKNAVVAAAVVAAIGAAAAAVGLAMVTTTGSNQPKPAVVAPGAAAVPATPPAAPVPPPATVAPASPPMVTPPDNGQPASGSGSASGDVGSTSGGNATLQDRIARGR
jgi:hypothetical protein